MGEGDKSRLELKDEWKRKGVQAMLGSRRSRSAGSASTWEDAITPRTASEQFRAVEVRAEAEALREIHDRDADLPIADDPLQVADLTPKAEAAKPPTKGASASQKHASAAKPPLKLPRVHTPNVAQVNEICSQIADSADVERRAELAAELAARDSEIAILRADLEHLGRTFQASMVRIEGRTSPKAAPIALAVGNDKKKVAKPEAQLPSAAPAAKTKVGDFDDKAVDRIESLNDRIAKRFAQMGVTAKHRVEDKSKASKKSKSSKKKKKIKYEPESDKDSSDSSSSDSSEDSEAESVTSAPSNSSEESSTSDEDRSRRSSRRKKKKAKGKGKGKNGKRATHWTMKPLGTKTHGLSSYRPTMLEFRRIFSYRLYTP